jgi:hypothetical protein
MAVCPLLVVGFRDRLYVRARRRAFRNPEPVDSQRQNHVCWVVDLRWREGTVAFWMHVSPLGSGVRKEQWRYPLACTGGYIANTVRVRNPLSLGRYPVEGTDSFAWRFMMGRDEDQPLMLGAAPDDLPAGWHFLACVWQASAEKPAEGSLFVDQNQYASVQPQQASAIRDAHPSVRGQAHLVVGTWTNFEQSHYVNEEMAWAGYWDTALSRQEVLALFALGRSTFQPQSRG